MTSKTCFKCGATRLLDDFYVHPRMKDGRLNKCKTCTKSDVRMRELLHPDAARERDRLKHLKRIAKVKAHDAKAEVKARRQASKKASLARHPERERARRQLNNAIRRGRIQPWPTCALPECTGKPEAHHPDYSRPFDVVWLCCEHHRAAHLLARPRKSISTI